MLWALFCGFAPFAVGVWLCGLLEDYTHRVYQRDMDRTFAEAMEKWKDYTPTPEEWARFYSPRSFQEARERALWRERAHWKINR